MIYPGLFKRFFCILPFENLLRDDLIAAREGKGAMRIPQFLAMAVVCLLLFVQGCFIPDQYTSLIVVKRDRIEFAYKGNVIDSVIIKTIQTKQVDEVKAKENTVKEMEAMKDRYKKSGVDAQVAYIRPGEFSISFAYYFNLKPDAKHAVFDGIEFQRIGTDKLRIETMDTTDAKLIEPITKYGIQSNGSVVVRVDPSIKVLDENATEKPGLLSNDYKWKLSFGSLPMRFVAQI